MNRRLFRCIGGKMAGSAGALFAISLLLFASLWLATTARADTPSVEDHVDALMRQGRFIDAYALAERAWPRGIPNRAMRLDFIRAMSLKAQGRHPEAIALLRRINA